MAEYVYALHEFVPEHEDEISFKAGERIEVVEKDDLYEDGWWKGINSYGKSGLFPKDYTTTQEPTPASDPTTARPPALNGPLLPLQEESESLHEDQEDGHQTVMRATMTDIQEAIEQLGVNQDPDSASRTFSFASTREETDDEPDGRGSSPPPATDGWARDARKLLAQNATKQNMRGAAAAAAVSSRPPIEVEMSDESEDEDDHTHFHTQPMVIPTTNSYDRSDGYNGNRPTSPVVRPLSPSPRSMSVSKLPESPPKARPNSPLGRVTPIIATVAPESDAEPDTDDTHGSVYTSKSPTAPTKDVSEFDPVPEVIPEEPETPTTAIAPTFSKTPFTEMTSSRLINPTIQSPAPTSAVAARAIPLPTSPPTSPAPPSIVTVVPVPPATPKLDTASKQAPAPVLLPALPVSAASPEPQSASSDRNAPPTGPATEWNVDQVVAWLRSKQFDEGICKKFIEHEITGDVLVELDLNMLKEIEIHAFGKRMKLANAITGLRRPPSIDSSVASLQFPRSPYGGGSSAPQSVHSPSQLYSPESAPNTGDIVGTPVTDRFGTSHDDRRDSDPGISANGTSVGTSVEDAKAVGLGIGGLAVPPAYSSGKNRNGKRPTSLALSPSESSLASKALWSGSSHSKKLSIATSTGETIPNIEEEIVERNALTDSETISTNGRATSKLRKGFGRSTGSASSLRSTNNTKTSGTDGRSTPITSVPPSPESIAAARTTPRTHKSKKSVDVGGKGASENRHSFFGTAIGKSRKPAPRYSDVSEGSPGPPPQEKHGRSLSRLYLSTGSTRRPRVPGSTPPSAVTSENGSVRNRTTSELSPRGNIAFQTSPKPDATPSPTAASTVDNGLTTLKPGVNPLDQIGEPDHEGWMRKKGERYNSWKLRYFVLKGPHLYYLRGKAETKIKGYINITGYKIIADENANPGRYGFRIIHDTGAAHYFSSEEQMIVRDWMKALMKATIGRDYSRPVVSSCNIPTIPLMVAQAMSPAPRPPSPTARDATQRALRRENPNQLSTRDARILMGLPHDSQQQQTVNASELVDGSVASSVPTVTNARPPPGRPGREMRKPAGARLSSEAQHQDADLIRWVNSHLAGIPHKATDLSASLSSGLVLFRLAESIKGIQPGGSDISDSIFAATPEEVEEKLDGLFALFDFLLDNDVRMGSVSINDVRQGDREKLVQLVKALRAWEGKRQSLERSLSGRAVGTGPFIGAAV